MKQFVIDTTPSGLRLIYPKHITHLTSEGPYIQITPMSNERAHYEVVRRGQVCNQGNLWSNSEDEIDRSIRRIFWLMNSL